MSQYSPPYSISNRMLELVSSISEKVGNITWRRELEARPQLRRNNRIRSIHSSLRIEANSLSLNEVRDVIGGQLVLGDQREIQEVKNAYRAYELISEIDPASADDLKRIHGIMTHLTLDDAGSYRIGAEGVFSGGKCIFVCPPPQMVGELMDALLSWVRELEGKVHPLIMAAVFHYEFVFIHPFSDGNGRMARLWHTVILYRWRSIFEYIPLESMIEKHQQEYYAAIDACHKVGNSNGFIEFMLELIEEALDDVILRLQADSAQASECVKRLLAVMEFDTPYTASELIERLSLRSRDTLRRNYLDPAIALGLVGMTVPDKPKSRNQRYVKKT